MYVSGQLTAVERVLVDVGTGYYVEMVGPCIMYVRRILLLSDSLPKEKNILEEESYQPKCCLAVFSPNSQWYFWKTVLKLEIVTSEVGNKPTIY